MSVPFFAKALFDYEAVEASELTVVTGDFLTVEEVNESGWCLARKGDLNGWLPTDYVQRIESEVGVAPEPIQVSKPQLSRETVMQEGGAGANSAPPAASSSSSSSSAAAPSLNALSEQLSMLVTGPSGAVTAPNPNAKICATCNEVIKSAFVMAKDKAFHPAHFQCFTCKKELGGRAYLEKDGSFYCEDDYYAAFNPKCGKCDEVIRGPYVSALDKSWHAEHFTCTQCDEPFNGNQFRKSTDGKPYCEKHFEELFAPKCSQCGLAINGSVFEALDQKYHLSCFCCAADQKPIGEGVMFHVHENKIYCPSHFEELFLQRCQGCKEVIKGPFIKVLEQHYHSECWKCVACSTNLKGDNCAVDNGKFYCKPCLIKQRATGPVFQQIGSNPQAAPDMPAAAPAKQTDPAEAAAKAEAALATIRAKQAAEAAAKEAAAAASASGSSSGASAFADPTSTTYPYSILKDKNAKPADVDPTKKEQYLSDAEFQELFKQSKADFGKLPEWRKKALKTPLMLF